MKHNQSGFTLIEIAIVLVIIGLLLGGVLKGQELINSAKVKNLAGDFKSTGLFIYNYQDKFHAMPGDDAQASQHVSGAFIATTGGTTGNGSIEGTWNLYTAAAATTESFLFWQHVRLSGIANGVTDTTDLVGYPPRNTLGGVLGVTNSTQMVITGAGGVQLRGTNIICSDAIPGSFAKQLDIMLDDGKTDTGTMMTIVAGTSASTAAVTTAMAFDTTLFAVCMGV